METGLGTANITDNYNFACVWLRGNGAREGIPDEAHEQGVEPTAWRAVKNGDSGKLVLIRIVFWLFLLSSWFSWFLLVLISWLETHCRTRGTSTLPATVCQVSAFVLPITGDRLRKLSRPALHPLVGGLHLVWFLSDFDRGHFSIAGAGPRFPPALYREKGIGWEDIRRGRANKAWWRVQWCNFFSTP
ncbi:hypothetical protein GGI35DRAFT_282844 [Trichoderma velutinum]